MQRKIFNTKLGGGAVGELSTSQPVRARGAYLCSAENDKDKTKDKRHLNVVGNAIYHHAKNDKIVGFFDLAEEIGALAGILGFPKSSVREGLVPCCGYGAMNDYDIKKEYQPIMNNQRVDVIQQGCMWVKIWKFTAVDYYQNSFSCNVGDYVYFEKETGKLTSITPKGKFSKTKGKNFRRLPGGTIDIENLETPAYENSYVIGRIYFDLAGDVTHLEEV